MTTQVGGAAGRAWHAQTLFSYHRGIHSHAAATRRVFLSRLPGDPPFLRRGGEGWLDGPMLAPDSIAASMELPPMTRGRESEGDEP